MDENENRRIGWGGMGRWSCEGRREVKSSKRGRDKGRNGDSKSGRGTEEKKRGERMGKGERG